MTLVIMFQDRFVPLIVAGVKHHTIRRPRRRRPIKASDKLSLRYWFGKAYRSPQILIHEADCLSVKPIRIDERDGIEIDGMSMRPSDQEELAVSDGFACLDDMLEWHREHNGLPFEGVLIDWKVTK